MQILVAQSGGFCSGVKRAVDTAMNIPPENVYILGEIIHNPEVVQRITNRGIKTVNDLDCVPDGSTLIIRSHGVQKSVYEACEKRNFVIHHLFNYKTLGIGIAVETTVGDGSCNTLCSYNRRHRCREHLS